MRISDWSSGGCSSDLVAIFAGLAAGQSGDSILEFDSNGNEDSLPSTFFRLANFTFLHRSSLASSINAMLFRGGADYTAVNGVVVSPRTCIDIDETGGTTTRGADAGLQDQGPPGFKSVGMQCGEIGRASCRERVCRYV